MKNIITVLLLAGFSVVLVTESSAAPTVDAFDSAISIKNPHVPIMEACIRNEDIARIERPLEEILRLPIEDETVSGCNPDIEPSANGPPSKEEPRSNRTRADT